MTLAAGNAINRVGAGGVETFRGWKQFTMTGIAYIDPSRPSRDVPFIIPSRQPGHDDEPFLIPAWSYIYRAALTIPPNVNWDNKPWDGTSASRCKIENTETSNTRDEFVILAGGSRALATLLGEARVVHNYEQVSMKLPGAEYGIRWSNQQDEDANGFRRTFYFDSSDLGDDPYLDVGQDWRTYKELDYAAQMIGGRHELETGGAATQTGSPILGTTGSLRLTVPTDVEPWTTFDGKLSAIVFEVSGHSPMIEATGLEAALAGTKLANGVNKFSV